MMKLDTTFNGWTNYETWVCALWLKNEFTTYKYIQLSIDELKQNFKDDELILNTANFLKQFIKNEYYTHHCSNQWGLFTDLLHYSIEQINYIEIAMSYLE